MWRRAHVPFLLSSSNWVRIDFSLWQQTSASNLWVACFRYVQRSYPCRAGNSTDELSENLTKLIGRNYQRHDINARELKGRLYLSDSRIAKHVSITQTPHTLRVAFRGPSNQYKAITSSPRINRWSVCSLKVQVDMECCYVSRLMAIQLNSETTSCERLKQVNLRGLCQCLMLLSAVGNQALACAEWPFKWKQKTYTADSFRRWVFRAGRPKTFPFIFEDETSVQPKKTLMVINFIHRDKAFI